MHLGFETLWAQAIPAGASAPGKNAEVELGFLAFRRWCGGLTLSSPDLTPRPYGLFAWLAGLAMLALVVMWLQGPRRALGQFFDLAGHFRLIGRAAWRVRQSARLVTCLLGTTVLIWSAYQLVRYTWPTGLESLVLLRKSRSPAELAIDHGLLAALTPFRDVCGLGDNFLLIFTAALLTFKRSADRWGVTAPSAPGVRVAYRPLPPWVTLCWGSAWLYTLYRLACMIGGSGSDLPIGGCIVFEAILVPALMAMADGLLLAWVVVEIRSVRLGAGAPTGVDVAGAIALLPGAVVTCLLLLPARYAATMVWLLGEHAPGFVIQSGLGAMVQGWGLVVLQAIALAFFGMTGGLAWARGGSASVGRGYVRLCRAEGGRVLAIALMATTTCGIVSGVAYLLMFSFPASTWLLNAADSYAHYATLPIALLTLAALVELRERCLPTATLANPASRNQPEPATASPSGIGPGD